MLELAEIKKTDILYDMGTCDGRIALNSQAYVAIVTASI
jgi:hypothetical protein